MIRPSPIGAVRADADDEVVCTSPTGMRARVEVFEEYEGLEGTASPTYW